MVVQAEEVEEGGGFGVDRGEEVMVGGEGAVEEVGPDVEGFVGEVLFRGDEVGLFLCGFGLVVQE